jgi:integrase
MSVQKVRNERSRVAKASDLADLAGLVKQRLVAEGSIAPVSLIRVSDLLDGFANFLSASGVRTATEIKEAHLVGFVRSLTRSGSEPSLATMHLRRSALRIFFREAKALGVLSIDPTQALVLPPRSYRDLRALTDKEVNRCRSSAEGMIGDARYAAAWALAEATARVPELGAIRPCDVDLNSNRVWIGGSSNTHPRWAELTSWGSERLDDLLSAKPELTADRPLLVTGKESRATVYELIASTLRRAGLTEQPGIRANSIPAWRGVRELAGGASIDEVAVLLGMRSLDRTATFIGFDWRAEP